MIVSDFLSLHSEFRRFAVQPEMDALSEADALQECQLLDVRFNAVAGQLGLLFELRNALQLRGGNTGLIVASGVDSFGWEAEQQRTALIARTVFGSEPVKSGNDFRLSLGLWRNASLVFQAKEAAFFVGNVQGLPEAPPDYSDADYSEVQAFLPSWDSQFVPVHATFSNP
jgi:hypothetical protein